MPISSVVPLVDQGLDTFVHTSFIEALKLSNVSGTLDAPPLLMLIYGQRGVWIKG